MKTVLLRAASSIFAFAGLCVALPAAPVESSRLTTATVYLDRARVEREAALTLPAGESEWTWERLPAALFDDSVRVSGSGESAVTVLDVTTRASHVTAAADPRVAELEAAIKKEERGIEALVQRQTILEQQRNLLQRIEGSVTAPPSKDSPSSRLAPDEWQKLLSFGEDQRRKFADTEAGLKDEKTQADARLAALRAQLLDLQGRLQGERVFKTVTVRLNAAAAGPLTLRLAYTVAGASWQPRYDARLITKDRAVELGYHALVRQATGEDWKNVALTLSTAQPGLGGAVPELHPWWVQVREMRRPAPMATGAAAENEDEVIELSPFSVDTKEDRGYSAKATLAGSRKRTQLADVASSSAAVTSHATSASFRVQAPATVLSDNSPQRVSVAQLRMPAELLYQVAPKLQETAFLAGKVSNDSDYPLLAGPVNVFLDDAFVATSFLKSVMPKEKFEVALGADEGIVVKRQIVSRFQEDTGLTSKGRRITYEFLITVTNQKQTAEKVVVREALPLSQDEKISIKLLTPAERDIGTSEKPRDLMREENGRLAWTLNLKAGEKRELPLKFSIEWPADLAVIGVE
ncbi:mucoidy inhibitor MuiA family protein [Nibricoccus sp. IMCC34717]|uniref:mucoidy inhibitor MuiA family protein n=1 Tax=Nibricoccus sp. IMCC34717 TaxID=3034021 RepID=UPI00384CF2E2